MIILFGYKKELKREREKTWFWTVIIEMYVVIEPFGSYSINTCRLRWKAKTEIIILHSFWKFQTSDNPQKQKRMFACYCRINAFILRWKKKQRTNQINKFQREWKKVFNENNCLPFFCTTNMLCSGIIFSFTSVRGQWKKGIYVCQ